MLGFGGDVTLSVIGEEIALQPLHVASTVNAYIPTGKPLWTEYIAAVAPGMGNPLRCH
jgi:hypothetical protein